jgi:hypothetical protein|tara:strand:+ start:137 stop:409 length:273 start_codon:yes stop_codon:yes gene_type:complete
MDAMNRATLRTFNKSTSRSGTSVPGYWFPTDETVWGVAQCITGEAIGEVVHDAQVSQMATFWVKRKGTQSFPPLNDCPWGSETMVMEREA